MRDVFLLGCERSGSTWLANIFDSHPDVEFIMEPFADYARLFPEIPDRNTHVAEASREHRAAMEAGYARLAAIKYPLLYKPGRPPWMCRVEQRAAGALRRSSHRLLRRRSLTQDRYQLLQLNNLATPLARMTRKHAHPNLRVTKELRLNFKTPLLHGAFPQARFIVVLRHPSAQIASVIRWMEQGQLGELGRALETFGPRVAEQDGLAPFVRAFGTPDPRDGIERKLAVWWALNYSVLLHDLEQGGAIHRVARHERIAENPSVEAARLLTFAGLAPDEAVGGYIDWSSHTDPLRHSATETVRNSAEFAEDAIRNAPERVTAAVKGVFDQLSRAQLLHEQLADGFAELAA